MSAKSKVLNALRGVTGQVTTAQLRRLAGDHIPQASMRRILNELRAEGHLLRGDAHGTWAPTASTSLAPSEDSGAVAQTEDAPVDLEGATMKIYRAEAYGDAIYFPAADVDEAQRLVSALYDGDAEAAVITIDEVEALPEGEEFFVFPDAQ